MRGDAFHRRALGQRAAAMVLEHAEMDQDVAIAVVGNEESKAAGRVEPFDSTRTMPPFGRRFRRRGHGLLRDSLLSRFVTQTLHGRFLTTNICVGEPTYA